MSKKEKQPVADILIVEDEVGHAEAIEEGLTRQGHHCTVTHDGTTAIARINSNAYDIVITDLMLGGDIDGLGVLAEAREKLPQAKVILITAHSSIETCRDALQNGAFDYIEKPLCLDELRAVVKRAAEMTAQKRTIAELKQRLDDKFGFGNIIGQSQPILKNLDVIRRVAKSDISVLLLGESGTGKELFANAIHQNSPRADKRFVAINCAGLSESLLEDELFGHVKGAFTGAATDREGRFEHADGGTLFLDEIGDMPMAMQVKLLRVLENGEVLRVGSNEPKKVDVRIISATNAEMEEKVASHDFREDLYFRIKGTTINIPTLRQRRDDIPLLIEHFIQQANKRHNTSIKGISPDARRTLIAYSWPGNIRQLKNVIENMVVMATGDRLEVEDLPDDIHTTPGSGDSSQLELAGISLVEAEKQLIANTLKMVDSNREKAATILGIGERTLYRKIKEYGLND